MADTGIRVARAGAGRGPIVTGLTAHGFRVDGTVMAGALLTPLWAREWQGGGFTRATLADLLGLAPPPEFLLLGTGASLVRPPADLVAALDGEGIGVEAMDSRAAARAWGVLRAEDRWIAAALLGF